MKDIVITANRVKKELVIYLVFFVIAYIANIYSIIKYETPWSELVTTIGFVLTISLVLYIIVGLIRTLIFLIKSAISR